ncbi:hypothetical protein HYC85_000888 [Camellia sinensis]|uniref:Uncharacterized protein n=1 Tax=Camellia sinensis TaxID=4442 RepID=A0A7J7I422_CAMSI|nr:hypothetical protein HYC85_000888 [Camellia sinensis]
MPIESWPQNRFKYFISTLYIKSQLLLRNRHKPILKTVTVETLEWAVTATSRRKLKWSQTHGEEVKTIRKMSGRS